MKPGLIWCVLPLFLAVSTARADIPINFLAQWGGPTDAVVIEGTTAYVGVGQHLEIVDVTDAGAPLLLGRTEPFVDWVRGVAVSGSYAYVAAAGAGLIIVDISDPTAPLQLGAHTLGMYCLDVVVVGNYAYVANAGNGLEIIDVTDPTNPTPSGRYDTTGEARKVTVVGDYAYVGDGFGGLVIVDVGVPEMPTLAGSVALPDYAAGVAVAGDYAYVTNSYNGGLQVVDVSVPALAHVVGYCTTGGMPSDVMVEGNYAFVGDDWLGLAVIDISDPTAPLKVNDLPGGPQTDDLFLAEGKVYLAEHTLGLKIIDVSLPPNTAFLGQYRPGSGEVTDLAMEGNYLYISDGSGGGGVKVLDVTDPYAPVLLGGVDTHEFAWGMTYHGGYVYLADGCAGLGIVDVTDPMNPTRLGEVGTGCAARDVVVQGNYAYVALDGGHGLTIVDVADPYAPVITGHWEDALNPGYALGVAVDDWLACLADEFQGLQIIDVLDPASPIRVGQFQTGTPIRDVALARGYAYLADEWTGLRIVDVATDPANPSQVGQCNFGGGTGVTLVGHYACVASAWEGLQIVDISDPTNPTRIGQYDTPGWARRVAIHGNTLCVADFFNGVVILDALLSGDYRWINAYGGDFAWADNWDPVGPPGPSDRAIFDLPFYYEVIMPPDADTTNDRLLVNYGPVALDLNGRVYTLQHSADGRPALTIGDDPLGLGTAELSVSNGDLNVTLESEAGLVVGRNSPGALIVHDGGNIHNAGMTHVAESNNSSAYLAILNINGTGGTLTSNYKMLVGIEGGSGAVDVDGYGSQLTILGRDINNPYDLVSLELGNNGGQGMMSITGGGQVYIPYGGAIQTGIVSVGGTGPGELIVDGDGSLLDAQFMLEVGRDGEGFLTVRDGGQVSLSGAPDDGGYTFVGLRMPGEVMVAGKDSLLTMNSELSVGMGHYGAMTISDQGTGRCSTLVVGDYPDSPTEGHLTITGAGSSLTTDLCRVGNNAFGALLVTEGASLTDNRQAQIGYVAHGTLDITAGGHVMSYKSTSATNSSSIIGWQAGSLGEVTVSGPGSTWTQDGVSSVGWWGEGRLTIAAGGQVDGVAGAIARLTGSTGTATVTGMGSQWAISDFLSVGGLMDAAGGAGTLNVNDNGLVTAGAALRVWSGSTVALAGGRVVVGSGPVPVVADTVAVYTGGTLSGTGSITGHVGNVSGQVAPGVSPGTLHIDGTYSQGGSGALSIEIGGTGDGQFDVLSITGSALLGGTLNITLGDGFVPALGNTFEIVRTDGTRTGTFANLTGQHAAAGLRFLPSYTEHRVILTVVPVVPADFDEDGDVDANDLAALAACFGGPTVPYPTGCGAKNLDGDADVDDSDFGVFQRCYSGANRPATPGCG